ncbi:MAG TPA: hypothetical protein PKY05_03345, partial [Fibrobacteria bacterium]|nr:hypothetical protein [Fibrobacteria bacterium]
RKGAFKYTSVSLYKDGGLRHLGVLGGANPAVKGLAPIAFGEGMFADPDGQVEGPHQILQFASEVDFQSTVGTALQRLAWRIRTIGTTFRSMRESIIESAGIDAANKQIPDYVIADLETLELPESTPVATPAFSEPTPPASGDTDPAPASSTSPGEPAPVTPTPATDPMGPGNGQTPRELELAAENDRLRKELRDREVEQTRKLFSERLDGLAQEGRLLPAQRTHLEALYKAIESNGYSFAEEGDLQSSLNGLLAAFPKQVEFGELPPGQGGATDPQSIASQIADLVAESEREGRPMSFTEATQKITNRRTQHGR